MARMITGLTKANIRNTGIELSPEHDFTDDGNRFRGFIYKGMPMTQCRADGECYLTIRVDYLSNEFTWNEWRVTEEYKLEDEFNGVSEFDLDKLIENLERIIAKRDEMNAAVKNEEVDMTEVIAKADAELKELASFIETVKTSLKWWNLGGYELKSASDYMARLIKILNNGYDFENLDRKEKKQMVERLRDYGYVIIKMHDNFSVDQLKKYMAK